MYASYSLMLIRANPEIFWWGLKTISLLATTLGFGLSSAGIYRNNFGEIIHRCFISGANNVIVDHGTPLRNTLIFFYMSAIGEWNVISSCFVLVWRSKNNMGSNFFIFYLFTADLTDSIIYNTHLYFSTVVPRIHRFIGKVVDNRSSEVQ